MNCISEVKKTALTPPKNKKKKIVNCISEVTKTALLPTPKKIVNCISEVTKTALTPPKEKKNSELYFWSNKNTPHSPKEKKQNKKKKNSVNLFLIIGDSQTKLSLFFISFCRFL